MAEKRSRVRKWAGMRNYLFETHDENKVRTDERTEDEWKAEVVKKLTEEPPGKRSAHVLSVAFVFHDRDIDDHGAPKPLHVHFVVDYKDGREREKVASETGFKDPKNVRSKNLEPVKASGSAYRYLTHTTDRAMKDGKVRYKVEELHVYTRNKDGKMVRLLGQDLEDWYRGKIQGKVNETPIKPDSEGAWHDLVEAVWRGKLYVNPTNVREWMNVRQDLYNMDDVGVSTFMRQRYKTLAEEADLARKAKAEEKMAMGRRLRSLYISGDGGLGKSKLARDLASDLIKTIYGVKDPRHFARHVYSASVGGGNGTFDPLGNYKDEEVTIMDDMSPLAFPSAEVFLKLFEPRTCPQVPSRNNDVYFLSEYVLVTKALAFDDWVKALADKAKEDKGMADQIRRRFDLVIRLESDCIRVLELTRGKLGGFKHVQKHVLEFPNLDYVSLLDEKSLSTRKQTELSKLEKKRKELIAILAGLLT